MNQYLLFIIIEDEVNDNRSLYSMVFRDYDNKDRAKIPNRKLDERNNREAILGTDRRLLANI